jgi:hypothetical protein
MSVEWRRSRYRKGGWVRDRARRRGPRYPVSRPDCTLMRGRDGKMVIVPRGTRRGRIGDDEWDRVK